MRLLFLFAASVLLSGCGPQSATQFHAGDLHITIDQDGNLASLDHDGADVLARKHEAPLLSLRVDSTILTPTGATWNEAEDILTLTYDGGRTAQVSITEKETHARLEVVALSDTSSVELVVWGPYPTVMNEVIGETVGVVQEDGFAMGIQALNMRTLGGYPWSENDALPQIDILDQEDYSDLSREGKRYVLFRVEAAKPDSFGSTLQAYTRNRNRDRFIPNGGFERHLAPAFEDGGMVGSAIALFGSPADQALDTIGAIEVVEGLPHPMLDGVWAKKAPRAAQAYVIMPFGEHNIDEALDVVEKAGMEILYHPEPFESWGHFPLRKDDFPNGVQGLKRLSDRASDRGMRLGAHTLSNFIQPNDPYVTPVPDERLAVVGSAALTSAVSASSSAISVTTPDPFRQGAERPMHTVRIGEELIQYSAVTEEEPWELTGLIRGAFGTQVSSHAAGDEAHLLADHGYRVFLTNPALSIEMAQNMAQVYAEGGLKHVSFDGLEGNRSTGMGNYGEILFAQSFWDAIPDEQKGDWIVTASRTAHYFWHLYTRMNWGEPWYAGFRESQTEYRMKNQPYFRRNFMPAMLGWFSLRAETSLEDIEWMLARSAAYDAGYALSTNMEALDENGRTEEILTLLDRWERARLGGHFSDDQKTRMEDVSGEFHLEEPDSGQFMLHSIATHHILYEQRERQPGEPEESSHSLQNPYDSQTLAFYIRAEEGDVVDLAIQVGGKPSGLTISLNEGQILAYRGGDSATVYSPSWQVVRRVQVDPSAFEVPSGMFSILTGAPGDASVSTAKIELRLKGPGEVVAKQ